MTHRRAVSKLYNSGLMMRARSIGKSLLLAFAGTGVVSFFLMMGVIPALAVLARLSGDVTQRSVVVNPAVFMRTYGIRLGALSFVVLFFVSLARFRRQEHAAATRQQ